jgi:hypothetical protein
MLLAALAAQASTQGASAQAICERVNDTPPATLATPVAAWFAYKLATTAPRLVSGAEFYLRSTGPTQTTIGFYDEDTATGRPNNLVASATAQLTPGVPGWYGAAFVPPVPVFPNTNYFVAVMQGPTIQAGMKTGGQPATYYFGPPAWSGPFTSRPLMFRVYCGVSTGAWTTYGAGKAGSGAVVPAIAGFGFPNGGNPINVQVSSTLGSAPALVLWGRQANLGTAIGTVYAFPILLTTASLTQGSGPGAGYADTEFAVPADASLAGAQLAFQAWIPDAGAQDSIAHTNGLALTIGN